MLRRHLIQALLPILLVLSGAGAQAADVTLTGKVVAASCTVNSGLVSGQEVNLGTLGRTRFQGAGDTGDWQSFALNLANCPAGTTKVTTTFTGTPDSNDATLFANSEPVATAASYIGIQMAQDANRGTILSNNSTMTVDVDLSTHSAVFPLAARMLTPTGGVQAGRVSGSVLVNFTYQ